MEVGIVQPDGAERIRLGEPALEPAEEQGAEHEHGEGGREGGNLEKI